MDNKSKIQSEFKNKFPRVRKTKVKNRAVSDSKCYDYIENEKAVTIPKDCSYDKIPEWILKYFPDRILLLNRAEKSLKYAVYEDVHLVWEAIKLLGTEYWQMRMGLIPKEDFDQKCKDLHLEEDATISDNRAGEKSASLKLQDDNGRKVKLDRHIKKGIDRDKRNCLRIYFYWDRQRKLVVIGHLPGHLETRNS